MNSNDSKKNANDPPAANTPVQNPASQPHGSTQDQVSEMESEGQATKQGQSPNPLQATPMHSQKPDEHKGAVEGDRSSDKEQGNKNAVGALDKDGLPKNKQAIAEDSIGARVDETQG
jgi:hypothetical protein